MPPSGNRPLRVLFFVTDLEIGGTPRVARDLALRLRGPDIRTAVACLAPWGPVAGEIDAGGVRVHPIGVTRSRQLPRAVRRLARLARRFDVVYSLLVHANAVAAWASPLLPSSTRLIQSIQTTQESPRWHWWLQGAVQGAAERIVVPSQSVADVAGQLSHVPAERITVIPNAIDVDSFAALPLPTFGPRLRVGFVGRLDPIKRVPDLVHAVAALPNVELHVFGEGEDRPRIEQAIIAAGVDNRATLHGATATPHAAVREIDVLVLPSDAEGFGLVLIEAMAAGRPVIATDVAGIRDVVRHGENGLLVPPRSPTSIAHAISRLRSDAALRERLCVRAMSDVRARNQWDNVLQAYRSLLLTPR